MIVNPQSKARVLEIALQGRLDGFRGEKLKEALAANLTNDTLCLVVDMSLVEYISSAGIRVLLAAMKRLEPKGGKVVLCSVRDYCRQVLDMTGFTAAFVVLGSPAEAEDYCAKLLRGQENASHWDKLESVPFADGIARVMPGDPAPASATVVGDIRDIHHATLVPELIRSKKLLADEYVVGVGGMGERAEDYFGILGELLSFGGMIAWLPTDGNNTPDFLAPRAGSVDFTYSLGFGLALNGPFNDLFYFESGNAAGDGTPLRDVYRALFAFAAKERRGVFKGALGMVCLARTPAFHGQALRRAPVESLAPANGKAIDSPDNLDAWYSSDIGHVESGAVICGVALDLMADLSGYDEAALNQAFALNPANVGGKTELVYSQAAVFRDLVLPAHPVDLEAAIHSLAADGDFQDLRQPLATTTVSKAMLGVYYLDAFVPDQHVVPQRAEANAAKRALSAYYHK